MQGEHRAAAEAAVHAAAVKKELATTIEKSTTAMADAEAARKEAALQPLEESHANTVETMQGEHRAAAEAAVHAAAAQREEAEAAAKLAANKADLQAADLQAADLQADLRRTCRRRRPRRANSSRMPRRRRSRRPALWRRLRTRPRARPW